MNSEIHAIFQKFYTLVTLADTLDKTPRNFGTDELLSRSEIHLVEVVGDQNETYSVTDIAKLLGVTKGAISQSLKRLEKKGLTLKQEDPANTSRAIVKLTSKGKTAYYAHKHWHETMDGGFKDYLAGLNPDQVSFLNQFLNRVENFYHRAMK